MPKKLQSGNTPVTGHGGEQSAAAYDAFDPSEVELLHNGLIGGRGLIEQAPDLIITKDSAGAAQPQQTPAGTELDAVCGIFPFVQQGDATSANSGVAFAVDLDNNNIYMSMLDEDHTINLNGGANFIVMVANDWTVATPPQTTGFEMENKFFFNFYGKEAASTRLGMGYFDPTGIVGVISSSAATPTEIQTTADHGFTTGDRVAIFGHSVATVNVMAAITVTDTDKFTMTGIASTGVADTSGEVYVRRPVYDLDDSGADEAALRYRGIVRHRGGTILGWGYRYETDANRGAFVRYCKYNTPLTWEIGVDVDDIRAGAFIAGTSGLEVVACASSGQYTIIGKESEIFALDGDYGSQFYLRKIGSAHGPVSTVGMVEITDAAVWMSSQGPAISERGGRVALIGPDKLNRTLRRYMDLTNTWGAHDSTRNRVVWTMRRKVDVDLLTTSETYAKELLVWDYEHNAWYTQLLPRMTWSVGVTRGVGLTTPGPVGVLAIDAASVITVNTFQINFTPNDTSPDVTYEFQIRENGTTTWTNAGTPVTVPGVTLVVTGLVAATAYDVRGKQVRNGQSSAWDTETGPYATTDAAVTAAVPNDPIGVDVLGQVSENPGISPAQYVEVGWTPVYDAGVTAVLFKGLTAVFAAATEQPGAVPSSVGSITDSLIRGYGDQVYYWIRLTNATGDSTEVAASGGIAPNFPYTVVGEGDE